jgi:transposase
MEEFSGVRFKERAVIELLTTEKVPQIEIHKRTQAVYGDQCVDMSTVRRWVRRFKDGELGFKNKTPIFLRTDFKN